MIDRATELQMSMLLRETYKEEVESAVRSDTPAAKKITCRLAPESLRTIIIQLRALGLIAKDERQRSVRDTQTYWSLTPYGDDAMTRLNAIPSKHKKG